jgi:hypothetical protein
MISGDSVGPDFAMLNLLIAHHHSSKKNARASLAPSGLEPSFSSFPPRHHRTSDRKKSNLENTLMLPALSN